MKATIRSLLDRLEKSRLVTKTEVAQAQAELTSAEGREDVALVNRLVEKRALTAWQGLQLLAGRTSFLLGPYKLLQRIGQGGVATVYQAQHTRIGHRVALKVFPRSLLQSPDAFARFRREMLASVRVNHPHVVSGFGSKWVAGQGVLIMEYVAGEDLARWLKRFGVLPIDWCCEVARQAALGLAHIHQRGLVHRDIKPSNLLAMGQSLREAPLVKVADLGAANIKYSAPGTRLTVMGNLLGTPNYVAPEQIDDPHAADHRSDIFSLGCTLFKLITSDHPWSGASLAELLAARTNQPPARLDQLREDVPPRLEQIIETMLARDPAQRFNSADDVAKELTEFAGRWACQLSPPEQTSSEPIRQPESSSPQILRIDRREIETCVIPPSGQIVGESPARQWRLLRVSLQGAAEAYLLHEPDTVILGRARDCHIRVRDVQVSRHHCRLTWKAGTWHVEDLGSVNKTHVNGQPVTASPLRNGDQIRLGSTRLWLVATSQTEADPAVIGARFISGQSGPA
jgi:serine/threonine protein kinase